jgi:hypothetical protein
MGRMACASPLSLQLSSSATRPAEMAGPRPRDASDPMGMPNRCRFLRKRKTNRHPKKMPRLETFIAHLAQTRIAVWLFGYSFLTYNPPNTWLYQPPATPCLCCTCARPALSLCKLCLLPPARKSPTLPIELHALVVALCLCLTGEKLCRCAAASHGHNHNHVG